MFLKKVVVLAYDFPPYNSIASQRPYSWLKYFPENDFDVTVITRHWDREIKSQHDFLLPSINRNTEVEVISERARIVRTPYNPLLNGQIVTKYGENRFVLVRKASSFLNSILRFQSFLFDEYHSIYRAAVEYMKVNKPDVIIATGEPFVLFRYAGLLSKQFNVKWVADYRDCWSNTVTLETSGTGRKLLFNGYYKPIEKKLIKTASLITTASPTYKKKLAELHPTKRIEVVYNGSDYENADELMRVEPDTEGFTIAYSGRFYTRQKLETFLRGFKQFVNAVPGVNARVVFYGLNFYPDMKKRLLQFDETLNRYFVVTDQVPYTQLAAKLRKAHVFLLLSDKGFNLLNAKVFDYLTLRRPILLVESDHGVLHDIVTAANAGYCADNAEQVAAWLTSMYNKRSDVAAFNTGKENDGEIYTRKAQARNFCNLLKQL